MIAEFRKKHPNDPRPDALIAAEVIRLLIETGMIDERQGVMIAGQFS